METLLERIIRLATSPIANIAATLMEDSKIIVNGETTILITPEGEKVICRPNGYECYDKETGIAMCIAKYLFGSRRKFLALVEKAKDQTPDHWSRK